MEDSKKKPIMIAVIVVCLGVAVAVTYLGTGGGGGTIEDIPDDMTTWVKCNNPQCKAEYQMSEKAYYKDVQERMSGTAMMTTPALVCEKCGEASVYRAEKCANPDCGLVFIQGSAGQNDFPDRCPKCGKSETEEIRKRRKAGGQ
ncbi:MAG: hypothetical protein A2Z25_12735 [Planctomycetes bacterium RBG_16_55_9]|nr:MAG: hypothetical protein A2Z25_12735 [Planctomycetes bacterium RBG_16_55_9]